MGWRTSFYEIEKDKPFMTEEYNINDDAKVIYYDFCTDAWWEIKDNEEFKKHIKCVYYSEDIDVYSIDKSGWLMFMEEIKNKHISYLKKLVDKKSDDSYLYQKTYKEYVENEIKDWETTLGENEDGEKYGLKFDYRTNNKYMSYGITWLDAFYSALYLYKTFDWENKELYVYGG